MAEFWNAATRQVEKNGVGIEVQEADLNAREFEEEFTLLPDNDAVYREWRRLLLAHEVKGVKAHDARLVAAMHVHGITHLLMFNRPDFLRYAGITGVAPVELSAAT